MKRPIYLGFDLSTQSLTTLLFDLDNGIEEKLSLNFDTALPQYGTKEGVPPSPDPTLAQADPMMWVQALDLMMQRLRDRNELQNIAAISVSAQQHGTVYLNAEFEKALEGLLPDKPMAEQLSGVLSRPLAPIWMDSSTSRQCSEITQAMGGDMNLVNITGSVATERFAASQIRKFWQQYPADYEHTASIALISSFITSLLCGHIAPVDAGDGLGTNLADVRTMQWSPEAIMAAAPGLAPRLPKFVSSDRVVGNIAPYHCERYGFAPSCQVVVGTGDNPASLAGLGLVGVQEVAAISLGTSDTYFGYTKSPLNRTSAEGHLFGAADGGYMYLICFKNGSLARAKIKDDHGLSWMDFSDILLKTQPGNQGRVMLPYLWPEITPKVLEPKIHRYGGLGELDAEANVRAVAEAQIMSMYLHSEWVGKRPHEVCVTAGGSENRGLLTTIAQVFGATVKAFEISDSAALGAALRAARIHLQTQGEDRSIAALNRAAIDLSKVETVAPDPASTAIYQGAHGLLEVYAACEKHALGDGPDPQAHIDHFKSHY